MLFLKWIWQPHYRLTLWSIFMFSDFYWFTQQLWTRANEVTVPILIIIIPSLKSPEMRNCLPLFPYFKRKTNTEKYCFAELHILFIFSTGTLHSFVFISAPFLWCYQVSQSLQVCFHHLWLLPSEEVTKRSIKRLLENASFWSKES